MQSIRHKQVQKYQALRLDHFQLNKFGLSISEEYDFIQQLSCKDRSGKKNRATEGVG